MLKNIFININCTLPIKERGAELENKISYAGENINITREELISNLKEVVSPVRFEHILRVEETALHLAKKYDYAALDKVSIAALMHDYCKEMPVEEMLDTAKQYSDDATIAEAGEAIWHGYAAARYGREHFAIKDRAILNAISQHTIGAEQMSLLSKIIFTADYIEPGRTFKSARKARQLAEISLEKAVYYKMKKTIKQLIKNNEPIYLRSVEIYNNWTKQREEL